MPYRFTNNLGSTKSKELTPQKGGSTHATF
jgi:hypothetical protein